MPAKWDVPPSSWLMESALPRRYSSLDERRHQNPLRHRASESPEADAAFLLARIHGMARQDVGLANKAVEWGERGLSDEQRPWLVHALALAQFRAGKTDEAIQTLKQQVETAAWSGQFQNQIALALAYRLSGDEQQAEAWIEKARQWQAEQQKAVVDGTFSVQIVDWLPFHVMLQEAERE